MSALVFILPEKYLLVFYYLLGLGVCGVSAKFLLWKVLKVYSERDTCLPSPREQRTAAASLQVLNWNTGAVALILMALRLDI